MMAKNTLGKALMFVGSVALLGWEFMFIDNISKLDGGNRIFSIEVAGLTFLVGGVVFMFGYYIRTHACPPMQLILLVSVVFLSQVFWKQFSFLGAIVLLSLIFIPFTMLFYLRRSKEIEDKLVNGNYDSL